MSLVALLWFFFQTYNVFPEMASADKETSQNQSEIPNRQHRNNDRKSREVAEMLNRRRLEIACVQETKWKGNKAR